MSHSSLISDFTFTRTPKIHFKAGGFNKLANIIEYTSANPISLKNGCRVVEATKAVLIVTGAHSLKSSGKWDVLIKALNNKCINYYDISIQSEPSPELIDEKVSEFKNKKVATVVAIGGGSVVDTGKAISAMLLQNTSVFDYLEGVGKGRIHNGVKVPLIAVPTTSGTGSEATKNAVLSRISIDGFKKSIRHDNFVPDIAIIDPELMLSCPPGITAACGMDAFTQLLESYVSTKSTPLTDALAYSGLQFLRDNLVLACTTGANNIEVRAGMAYASLISGITLANAGLGIVHGLASPIGGFFNIPHGVVCGTLIGEATKVNIERLESRNGSEDIALRKYAEIGRLITGSESKDIKYCCKLLTEKIDEWTKTLKLPLLTEYGIKSSDIGKIIEKTGNKNNPIKLNNEEIETILSGRM